MRKSLLTLLALCLLTLSAQAAGIDFDVNEPTGSRTVSSLDDYIRETRADVREFAIEEHYTTGIHKIPSGTAAQIAALTPAAGRVAYNTTTGALVYGNGTAWVGTNGAVTVPFAVITTYGNSLTTAITSLGVTKTTLVVNADTSLSAHTVVPENITLWFIGDGKITLGNYNLTLNCVVDAPRRKIFDYTGSGAVTRGSSGPQRLYVDWFGAVGDNAVTNDYTAILNTINAHSSSAGEVVFAGKNFLSSGTQLTIPNNITLTFVSGGKLSLLNHDAVFNGHILTGPQLPQVFVYTGSGVAKKGATGPSKVFPEWFGTGFTGLSGANNFFTTEVGTITFTSGDYAASSNITFTNATLDITRGSRLSVANGATATVGSFRCTGMYQLFTWAGTGKVVFVGSSIPEVFPQWWGAVCNGAADDSAALNAAILCAYNSDKLRVRLTAGVLFCGTTTINHYPYVIVEGNGIGVSTLRFGAAPIGWQTVDASGSAVADSKDTTNHPALEQLTLDGAGVATDGMRLYTASRGYFRNIEVINFTGIGLELRGGKADTGAFYSNFYSCRILGNGTNVKFTEGLSTSPNGNTWFGGQISAATVKGIHTTGTAARNHFYSVELETNADAIYHDASGDGWTWEGCSVEASVGTITFTANSAFSRYRGVISNAVTVINDGTSSTIEDNSTPGSVITSRGQILRHTGAAGNVFGARQYGDVDNKWLVRADGEMSFGNGTLAPDVTLQRSTILTERKTLATVRGPDSATELIASRKVAKLTTTDATPTAIGNRTLTDGYAYLVVAHFVVVRSNGNDRAAFTRTATVYRSGGAAVLEGAVTANHTARSDAGIDATIIVTGNDVAGQATGVVGKTLRWRIWLEVLPLGEAES